MLTDLTKVAAASIAPLFGLVSIFNALGRCFWGALSDRIGCQHTFAAMFAVQAVTLFLLAHSHTLDARAWRRVDDFALLRRRIRNDALVQCRLLRHEVHGTELRPDSIGVGLCRIDRTHHRRSRQRSDRIILTNVAAHRNCAAGIRDTSLHHQETSATIRCRRRPRVHRFSPFRSSATVTRSKFGLTTGAIVMSSPSRLQIGILANNRHLDRLFSRRARRTEDVGSLDRGASSFNRSVRNSPAQSVAATLDEQYLNQPPR